MPPASIAVVVGVTGGLGGALATTLQAQGRYDQVVGLARRRPDGWPERWPKSWPFIAADILNEDDLASAAQTLVAVMDGLTADDNGGFFAWDGSRIEW